MSDQLLFCGIGIVLVISAASTIGRILDSAERGDADKGAGWYVTNGVYFLFQVVVILGVIFREQAATAK